MRPLHFSVGYSGQPATPLAFSRLPRSAEGHGTPAPSSGRILLWASVTREEVARALANLAGHDENKTVVTQLGGLGGLVALLGDPSASSREEAARALANLAGNDENKLAIAANGGIMPLIMLLRDSHPPAREEAARALVNLAVDDDNKVAIAQAGGVMPLITCLSPRRAYYV